MDVELLRQDLARFRSEVLDELRALRAELAQLRENPSAPVAAPPVAPGAPADFSLWWERVPEDLRKRLQPMLAAPPEGDGKPRALWLLELSENIEDYLRYQGDEWPQAEEFLAAFQDYLAQHGLARVHPRAGDSFDSRVHLLLQSLPDPGKRDQIARCARPGYAYGGEILRRAEVVVYL